LTPKGALDSTFAPVEPFGCESPNHWTATTARLAIQPDGRIVIAASWQDCALRSYSGVYRLLENGAMDPEFIPASPIENPSALALQADGGILVAGTVGVPCETQRSLLRRLHPDGRLDTGFNPEFAHAVPCRHGVLAILAETGRIWVVGDFDRVNGLPSSGLAWLNPDGSSPAQPDLRFESVARVDFAGSVSHGAVFVSGRSFDAVNGINRRSFAKLHASGSLDPSFEVTDSRWLSLAARSALPLLPTGGPEVLMMSSNRPAARLLASGAVDPAFALPRDLAGLYSEWQTQMDSRDRLVCTTVSNRILRAFRLMPNGSWDAGYTPFTREPVSSWSVAGHLTALDSTDRLLVAGAVVSNTFGGILRLRPDGGLDPSFGPPPLPLGGVVGLALGSDGAPVVMAGIPSRPVWLTTDGRRLEGANSLPPLPGGSMASNVLRGFTMDARDRLYLILQSDLANFVAYRFTAGRDWDRSFVVTGRGSYANATLSKDGDWLYITGAMEANGMRSGGLVRVSTLETPRIEIIGSSPFFGTELRLTGEPGRRHRVETSGDLRTWQAFVDLTLGEQPEWLTDWIGWGEPQRFYRLLFVADPSRAEAAAAGP
jgi:uncharacterized delta-60 repeat protein